MLIYGHNASLNKLDGVRILGREPSLWGPLVPKAEYLSQFGKIKAWEIYILPHQLRPLALEQLANAISQLSKHPLFAELDWLSFHFPTSPQSHHRTAEISQEKWRPFYQLLQVLDRFSGAKRKTLNFHILAEFSLAEVWQMNKDNNLLATHETIQTQSRETLAYAYRLRDQLNPKLHLSVENNPPYHNKAHRFHFAGLFPTELRRWQHSGVEFLLDIQHASLVHWYRERYGYDGPIPIMNEIHHRTSLDGFCELDPLYIHAAGAPDTPESLHHGLTVGVAEDDVPWGEWMPEIRKIAEHKDLPVIIELEDGHLSEYWPACQTSVDFLKKLP